jgi:hypothetical protein
MRGEAGRMACRFTRIALVTERSRYGADLVDAVRIQRIAVVVKVQPLAMISG